jgi:NTE family protein
VLPTVLLGKEVSPAGNTSKELIPFTPIDGQRVPCRTRFTWQQLEQLSPAALLGHTLEELNLDSGTLDSLSRWARAITSRRVGVSLSGGGSWGFYHVVLLNELLENGIPIDILSGASMGSMVAAAFSAKGREGLTLLTEMANDYQLLVTSFLSFINTRPIEWLINCNFGDLQLQELLTSFYPVTTDITTGSQVTLAKGGLSLAVRASSSAPGIFGPTLENRTRYVDGCASNNLPVTALIQGGADLTFASNCYPAAYREYCQLIPGSIGAFLSELNPLGRVADLLTSGSIGLSSLGEQSALLANARYDPKPAKYPLLKAMGLLSADEVLAMANQDEKLKEAVQQFKLLWEATRWRRRVGEAASRRVA